MTANLRLVVNNVSLDTQKIVDSIRPLDRKVVPSVRFRRRMKLTLLDLPRETGPAQAA